MYLATTAVETKGNGCVFSNDGSGNTHTRENEVPYLPRRHGRCLRAARKGTVLAATAVQTQGKGSVLPCRLASPATRPRWPPASPVHLAAENAFSRKARHRTARRRIWQRRKTEHAQTTTRTARAHTLVHHRAASPSRDDQHALVQCAARRTSRVWAGHIAARHSAGTQRRDAVQGRSAGSSAGQVASPSGLKQIILAQLATARSSVTSSGTAPPNTGSQARRGAIVAMCTFAVFWRVYTRSLRTGCSTRG